MQKVKQSFLSNLVGSKSYDGFLEYAKPVVLIGSCVLIVLYTLSSFFHWEILSRLIDLTNGLSLLFIAFIAEFILLLDIRVEVEEPERNYWDKTEKSPKPFTYKLTIIWDFILIIIGILAIYYSYKYSKQYGSVAKVRG
mgnify:CR=1 FL=1